MLKEDPTEFLFANEYLDGWQHWKTLCEAPFFKPYIAKWREELELQIRAKALAQVIETSRSGSKDAYTATKFLVEGGYTPKATKGRPSKAEVSARAKEIAEDQLRVNEDFDRVVRMTMPN